MRRKLRVVRFGFYLLVLITLASCSKKYFEGKILYKYQYLDKEGKDITDRMKTVGGAEQHYFINARSYKSKNELNQLTQLYNSATNVYYFNVGLELEKVDAAKEFPKKNESKLLNDKQTILGILCQSLQMISEVSSTTYYYRKKIKVDPGPFSKHRFGNWNNYLSMTKGALPLKFTVAFDSYTLTATAVSITPLQLSDSEFEVKKALEK